MASTLRKPILIEPGRILRDAACPLAQPDPTLRAPFRAVLLSGFKPGRL
jgi:hypothetical protein